MLKITPINEGAVKRKRKYYSSKYYPLLKTDILENKRSRKSQMKR